ncbi:branched-chain amino acid ABC transporter permease [Enterocloster aldenensis]|uniref:branched-chain amino acid ABC transporter permease n=1 Tax=Enterocloster aldenensis TaxID=358742 RepID=UPI0040250A51
MKKKIDFSRTELRISFVLLAVAFLIPSIIKDNYIVSIILTCFLYGSFGMSWNVLGGFGGQISWCHSAFAAIGAYTALVFYNFFGISPLISMPIGVLLSYAFATLLGKVTLRYRGPFFAITTIAFAEILRVILLNLNSITGGSAGLYVRYNGEQPWNLVFSTDKPFYYIALVLMIIVLLVTKYVENSKMGYFLRAIKGDEDAAQSLGMDTPAVKLHAFQLSAAIISVAGMVYGCYMGYIEPQTMCGLDLSIKIGAVVIIGGVGSVWGPILGAFIVIPAIEFASAFMGNVGGVGGTQLFYGLILIIVVILRPEGMISLFDKETWSGAVLKLQRKKASADTERRK